MRSLGRLVVRGKYLTNPIYTNCTRTISTRRRIKDSYVFPTILNDFNLSGYTDCKHYHTEAETDGGSDFKYKRSIRKGDTISLNDLLFTSNRDYLIKKNNQYVKADHLNDKVIGIYFLPLTNKDPEHSMWHTVLKDVYDDLYPAKKFEIVLVACNDPDTNFREEMPM
ncbi:hypothetical protein POM88_027376 [Heracleum sosnowskyi]|uniref:Uncharacterized protein n=1 Tax=Heracleum sosnowskyi TaxID=360622 RepID=A0AAD8I7H9_9APIA|nr:hypothetical protein POM88_027376 [Heracleum sosnowskyi]